MKPKCGWLRIIKDVDGSAMPEGATWMMKKAAVFWIFVEEADFRRGSSWTLICDAEEDVFDHCQVGISHHWLGVHFQWII